MINNTNLPKVYHDVTEYNLDDNVPNGKAKYVRDRSLEIYSGNDEVEILSIGDSFTNGGNTFWDNSYPFKLYTKFNKKITVRNLGVCSSTTEQIADRLNKFYQSNQFQKNKKYIVVVLAGSADLFSGSKLIQTIPNLDISKNQKWFDMNYLITKEQRNVFFSGIYTYKVLKILFHEIGQRLQLSRVYPIEQVAFSSIGLESCIKFEESEYRIACLTKILNQDSYKHVEKGLKEYLIIRFLLERKNLKSSEVTNTIRDFMTLIDREPQLLERDFLVMNLVSLVNLQDIISYKEIAKFIRNKSSILSSGAKKVNEELLANADHWSSNLDNLNKERDIYWKRINQLTKEYNSELIVMNYPLTYKSTNSYLEKMAKDLNLEFINLEKIFDLEKVKNQKLVDDWEHCSPTGYDLIATILYGKIVEESKIYKMSIR